MKSILVIDDDAIRRTAMATDLREQGVDVNEQADLVLDTLGAVDAIVAVDEKVLDALNAVASLAPTVLLSANPSVKASVTALQAGAKDYLALPASSSDLMAAIERATAYSVRKPVVDSEPVEMIGSSEIMDTLRQRIAKIGPTDSTVLILGQSGTGKELVANALHRHSMRKDGPFVALNMAAIPQDLIESELFGHEKGAFTGANQARVGRFEQARGGTLFLDEIGVMPAEAQTRLLRVLSDGKYYRVGGHEPLEADVRIIAATHQNLETLVSDNRFREDLFHRLNVIRIHLPNLCDRSEDIPMLLEHFLAEAARELGEEMKVIPEDTMNFLVSLPWQGNVRQLENFSRWITVMATGREVLLDDLPLELRSNSEQPEQSDQLWDRQLRKWAQAKLKSRTFSGEGLLAEAQPLFERIMIEAALDETAGRKRDASLLLGWGRNTLTRKMQELGMDQGNASDG